MGWIIEILLRKCFYVCHTAVMSCGRTDALCEGSGDEVFLHGFTTKRIREKIRVVPEFAVVRGDGDLLIVTGPPSWVDFDGLRVAFFGFGTSVCRQQPYGARRSRLVIERAISDVPHVVGNVVDILRWTIDHVVVGGGPGRLYGMSVRWPFSRGSARCGIRKLRWSR